MGRCFKGSVQNKLCSYFVSLRQGRGGGVHPKIFVSKPKMPKKMSKCLRDFCGGLKPPTRHRINNAKSLLLISPRDMPFRE